MRSRFQFFGFREVQVGAALAACANMTLEVALGRTFALLAHPYAAWRVLRPKGRALLVGAYFVASYTSALFVLLSLQ